MISTTGMGNLNKNSFLYSSDEENEDVEIMFDDSSDECYNSDRNEDITGLEKVHSLIAKNGRADDIVSIKKENIKQTHRLIELLKNDKASNEITLLHKKFRDRNEYLLFSDRENFIKYQMTELNAILNNFTNMFVSLLCDNNETTLEDYKDTLISILCTNSWSTSEIEKKLHASDDGFDLLTHSGIGNEMIVVDSFEENSKDCPICCETITDFKTTPFIKISSCNYGDHLACKTCYNMYLKNNFSENFNIACIGGTCKKKISYISIKKFDETYFKNLIKFSLLQCCNDLNNSTINNCPEQDCENIIFTQYNDDSENSTTPRANLEPVTCISLHKFCLTCKKESHSPITCNLLKKWFNKINDGNESLNWVLNNTQPCPNCDVDIEKIDGCNHMKCGYCKHEFCWICNKDWAGHGGSFYDCMHKRDIDSKKEKSMQTDSFNRFRNYYKFFIESENNMLLDMRLFNKLTSKKLNNLSTLFGMSFVELEFLNDCLREVVQARNMIKYSFAFLYFIDQSHNLFFIFTHNQMALLAKIDEISDLLLDINMDSTIPNSKRDIKVLQMKPYLVQSTLILKKLQTNLSKCGEDLVTKKLVIYS